MRYLTLFWCTRGLYVADWKVPSKRKKCIKVSKFEALTLVCVFCWALGRQTMTWKTEPSSRLCPNVMLIIRKVEPNQYTLLLYYQLNYLSIIGLEPSSNTTYKKNCYSILLDSSVYSSLNGLFILLFLLFEYTFEKQKSWASLKGLIKSIDINKTNKKKQKVKHQSQLTLTLTLSLS